MKPAVTPHVVPTEPGRPCCDFVALEQVLEALHEPVWIVAPSGYILRGNAAARAVATEVAEAVRYATNDDFDDPRFVVSRVETRTSVVSLVVGRGALRHPWLPPKLARVASLAARGLADKAIALELKAPLSTVRTYMQRIYTRLGVRSRGELARRWLRTR